MRALKYDMPGADWRIDPEALRRSVWRTVFQPELASPRRLVVEIGYGRGEFLMDLARSAPETAFLGIELSFRRHLKMARRLARTDLRNVRLVLADATAVVADLAEGSVSGFWINYPDPWPKKRHHRRRLLTPRFAHALARRLEPGGSLSVATDHAEYAEAIDGVLSAEPEVENRYAPDAFRREVADRMPTAFELEWRAQGRPLHYFDYRRIDPVFGAPGRAPLH